MGYDLSDRCEDEREELNNDIKEMREILVDLYYRMDNLNDEGILPNDMIRKFQDTMSETCSHLGHTWESDSCNYLDCVRCTFCSASPSSLEELNQIIVKFPTKVIKIKDGKFKEFLTFIPKDKYKHLL